MSPAALLNMCLSSLFNECQNTFSVVFLLQGGDGQPPKADGGTYSNST